VGAPPGRVLSQLPDVPGALGDLGDQEFREALRRASGWASAYLEGVGDLPVMPPTAPGDIRRALPLSAPAGDEPMTSILDDFENIIVPGITHWNHPRFMAYFGVTGSMPGIVAELLVATLNVNAMLWRTSPAATELEEVTTSWLAQAMGLPASFSGVINDTASSSTLYALVAARQAIPGLDVRQSGVSGLDLVMYTSAEAHSSVEKAGLVLGLGHRGVRKVPVDGAFRMDVARLEEMVGEDRAAGRIPFAVTATVGTTSTTSVDPVDDIAAVCERERLWLHVDAAYGGAAAIVPGMRWVMDGCSKADSLVVNPHKWLFTPIDCSVLYTRREDVLGRAFSIVPDYLATSETGVRNLMDFGSSLGRRFRALKLWLVLRAFGLEGAAERIRAHIAMAAELRRWVEADSRFEVVAPSPFSTVCFRHAGLAGEPSDRLNQEIVDAVNRSGIALISQTRVGDRLAIRVAIGNIRTTLQDVRITWDAIVAEAARAAGGSAYVAAERGP
jgi:aromatic-L-amino-acid decarboxylase